MELDGALPIVATGHLTTVGASASESVREIYVGSLEAFPTDAFPPAAYIALGHIHRPQKVGGLENIRYCVEQQIPFYHVGQGAQETKAHLGATLVPSFVLFKHRRPMVDRFLFERPVQCLKARRGLSTAWDRLLASAFPSPATTPAFASPIPGSTALACVP